MGSLDQHLAQAQNNEKLVVQMATLVPRNLHWEIVVTFYAALHYVDSVLAITPTGRGRRGIHPPLHRARDTYVQQHLPEIYGAYRSLKNLSRVARYEPWRQRTVVDLTRAQAELAAVKSAVSRRVGRRLP